MNHNKCDNIAKYSKLSYNNTQHSLHG